MSSERENQVRQILADVLGISASSITPTTSPEDVENWDSVQHLNVILSLEQAFGLQIDPEDIATSRSFGELLALVDRKAASAK